MRLDSLYSRYVAIINPNWKYFAKDSDCFRKGKQAFIKSVKQGNANEFISLLVEELSNISDTGCEEYRKEVNAVLSTLEMEAWKRQSVTVELTNSDVLFIESVLRGGCAKKADANKAQAIISKMKGGNLA